MGRGTCPTVMVLPSFPAKWTYINTPLETKKVVHHSLSQTLQTRTEFAFTQLEPVFVRPDTQATCFKVPEYAAMLNLKAVTQLWQERGRQA